MIFVDNIKKESMTLSELIRKHDFESILPSMKEFYEDASGCLAPYKESYDVLRLMEPDSNFEKEEEKEITISWHSEEEEKRWIGVHGASSEWSHVLAKEIKVADDLSLTETDVLVHCLWEITFFGFIPRQRKTVMDDWEPRKIPHNKYEEALWALQLRMYKNEVRKKDRAYDESGKGVYTWNGKFPFDNHRLNRSKRKRLFRQENRERYLEKMAKRAYLIQQITKDSNLNPSDVDYIMHIKSGIKLHFESHVNNVKQRIPYLEELLTKYFDWTGEHGTDIVAITRTSSNNKLLAEERNWIKEFLNRFDCNIILGDGIDEELGCNFSLTLLLNNK